MNIHYKSQHHNNAMKDILLCVCLTESCALYLCTLQVHQKDRFGLLYQETQTKIISVFACSSLSKLQVVRPSKDTWCLCGRVVKITQQCICYIPCSVDLPSCYCKAKRRGRTNIFRQATVCTEMIPILLCRRQRSTVANLMVLHTSQLIVTELRHTYT